MQLTTWNILWKLENPEETQYVTIIMNIFLLQLTISNTFEVAYMKELFLPSQNAKLDTTSYKFLSSIPIFPFNSMQ